MHSKTGPLVLLCAGAIAIGVPAVAAGFGEGESLEQGSRNPSANASMALTSETEIIAQNGTYGTRQSNKTDGDGGGAIYGCRSSLGNEPCVRANNLKGGRAFEFVTIGKQAGAILLGDPSGAPFVTNATGVATGLNADRVDGHEATDFAGAADLLWAAVGSDGKLGAKRGVSGASLADKDKGTYSIAFDRDVTACTYTATAIGDTADADVAFAVRRAQDPKTVLVDQADATTHRTEFHLQVLC